MTRAIDRATNALPYLVRMDALDAGAGRPGQHLDHAADRRGDDAHLLVGYQHPGRQRARAGFVAAADSLRDDAQGLDLCGLQGERLGAVGERAGQGQQEEGQGGSGVHDWGAGSGMGCAGV